VLRFIGSFFGAIFTAITLGILFGALTIGAIFWIYSSDLPSHESLAQYTPPTISRIYSGEGRIIDEFAQERRLFVPIEDMPEMVKHAFVSAEDKHFYTHKGYDVTGMAAAFRDAIVSRGANMRGASTITQQVMKNFLLDGSRSVERKVKRSSASRLEKRCRRTRSELYLNKFSLARTLTGWRLRQNLFQQVAGRTDLPRLPRWPRCRKPSVITRYRGKS
jgi:penicillin-binding protein 1A